MGSILKNYGEIPLSILGLVEAPGLQRAVLSGFGWDDGKSSYELSGCSILSNRKAAEPLAGCKKIGEDQCAADPVCLFRSGWV
jgi:hypothetical protein